MAKPVVIVFVGRYLPGYRGGGPIRSIANLVDHLGDELDFRIITRDRDLGAQRSYESIVVDAWNTVGKAQVYYASNRALSLRHLGKLMRDTPHSILYLNSFFSFSFSSLPLLARWLGLAPKVPVILAPRGEFSEGALVQRRWKKTPFIYFARITGLFRQVRWHASTEYELLDIENTIGANRASIHIARNLPLAEMPHLSLAGGDLVAKKDDCIAALEICFLSRIVEKKNLHFALNILGKLDLRINFDIYGPIESNPYWEFCLSIIKGLPENIVVTYRGGVEHCQVRTIIEKYNILFVPSLGENFGHVFHEALSAGVPILVSDRTAWRGLESRGVGWDISLSQPQKFIDAIIRSGSLSVAEQKLKRIQCMAFAHEIGKDDMAIQMNKKLFFDSIARQSGDVGD